MKKKLITILTLIGLFLSPLIIVAQYNFEDVVDQTVLGLGEPGEWDSGLAWMPCVIKDGDTLKMWYIGADEWLFSGPPSSIGYAWSLDGVEWNRYSGNPIMEAEFDWEGLYLIGCAVIKEDGIFKMWYGANANPMSASTIIGYATSVDGINWIKHPTGVLELGPQSDWDDGCIQPNSVIKKDGMYMMWYWAGRPGFPFQQSMPQIGLATSTDGVNWTKYDDPTTTESPYAYSDPVLPYGPEGAWDAHRAIIPSVLKKGSGYEMWYTSLSWDEVTSPTEVADQIGYAQSEDGINWVKYPEPILTDPREWGVDLNGGTVLYYDNTYHLWYSCFHFPDAMAQPQIGYATAITPQQMVDDIIAKVEVLEDEGVLNKGQANALIKKLESAKKSIEQEKYIPAINKLNAFINQVNAFMYAGILSYEQGIDLINDAHAIIDILENLYVFKIGEAGLADNTEIDDINSLKQNYPNPFSDNTAISFTLAEANFTTLKVYNSMGQEVATLFDQLAIANKSYKVEFNGNALRQGIYICVLKTEQATQIIKMIKMK